MSEQKSLDLANILVAPIVSEKSTRMGDKANTVAFWVTLKASKHSVKQAVEAWFNVKVESVRTLIKGRNNVRFGQLFGKTVKQKKAYIKLSAGHQINLAEIEG